MDYSLINWEDSPSTKTPINTKNLDHMDRGIFDAHKKFEALPKWSKEEEKPKYTAGDVGTYTKEEIDTYKANSILSKASGEVITTTDSAKVKPKNIKLFGKGEQRQYEGNQLLNIPDAETESQGIVWTSKGGVITAKGTSANISSTKLQIQFDLLGMVGDFYISDDGNKADTFIMVIKDGTTNWYNNRAFSLDGTETEAVVYFQVSTGVTVDETIHPMLNLGTEKKPWEPFVGNEPSPSMNYPQKVESHGESGSIRGKVLTSNYCDAQKAFANQIENGLATVNNNGSVTLNGEITNKGGLWDVFVTLPAGSYYFNEPQSILHTFASGSDGLWNNKNAYVLTEETIVKCYIAKGTYNNVTIYPMISTTYGAEFQPCTEQPFTFQTPNGLRGIPLGQTIPDAIKNSPIHMNGVYWDEAEQQYHIANTKNENGKDVQRIGKVDNDNWKKSNVQADTNGHRFVYDLDMIAIAYVPCLCTHYTQTNKGSFTVEGDYISTSSGGVLYIRTLNTDFDNIDDFKAHVKEVGMETYYILAEPIITDTTEEEKAQLDALVMNYPNTTIVNDEGAYMEVEYVCDPKKHIEQNYTPNSVTQDILERLGNVESQIALNS